MNQLEDRTQNYIDRRRTTSISKAWLIERTQVITIHVAYTCDYWTGEGFTANQNLAMRFTRWVDAATAISAHLAQYSGYDPITQQWLADLGPYAPKFTPTFHRDLVPLAHSGNLTGILKE
jgi:hypothetical protein